MTRWRRRALGGLLGLYLVGLGFVGGIVVERWRFDQQRRELIAHYDTLVRRLRAGQMRAEQGAPPRATERAASPAEPGASGAEAAGR